MEFDASSLIVGNDRSVLRGREVFIVFAKGSWLVSVVSDGSVVFVIFCNLFIVTLYDVFFVPPIVV